MTTALGVSRFGERLSVIGRVLSGRVAAISLAALAIAAGAATYAWLTGFAPATFSTTGWMTGLLVADLVVATTLVAFLAVRLTQLWLDRRRGAAGSRLHMRLVLICSLFTVTPTLIVTIILSLLVINLTDFVVKPSQTAFETARAIGRWVLADDSGLAVDALKGAPGVHSARYSGTHGDDDANNRKLLESLAAVPDERRGAAFVCSLALADPSGTIRLEADGACRGRITHEVRGAGGFGYDPLFLIPEYHRTFGELSPLVKHQLSHRARAFAHLRPALDRLIALQASGTAGIEWR